MATILIFSENWQIAHKLCDSYAKEKYDARLCSDPDQISAAADENGAPLMVIDAAMKWVVCRPIFERCRQTGSPILFVTSDRRMSDHLLALYPGRSDVVVTPFSRKTLAEKTRILLGGETPAREISVDETAQVALLNGRRVELTAQEMALLLALMNQPDTPVSREQLLREAWGYQSMGETRTVDVHVQRLRKKLGEDWIETVYKCGYRRRLA